MYALEIWINGQKIVTGGAPDLGVLSAGIAVLGMLGPEATTSRHGEAVDATLRVGGMTARADGPDEHLEWLRSDLKSGDVVSIRILETENVDKVIGRRDDRQIEDDERAHFEQCKSVYLDLRSKYDPL